MSILSRVSHRIFAIAAALTLSSGCSQIGQLGSVLGSAGQPQTGQVSGTVQTVDTRSQQIVLNASNGQQIAVYYDANTQVTYQNRNYAVANLERGDQVTARIQQAQNGGYYTDLVQVDRSVQGSGGVYSSNGSVENVQTLQGTVRQVDRQNGFFTVDVGNYSTVTVSLPYRPSQADVQRFQALRAGDAVRFYGVFLNNSRVELRGFY